MINMINPILNSEGNGRKVIRKEQAVYNLKYILPVGNKETIRYNSFSDIQ